MTVLNTLPATPLPDLPVQVTPADKRTETQFGDSYKLVAQDGVNATTHTVRINWSKLNWGEKLIIWSFIEAHATNATPFYYTAAEVGQKPYIVTQRSVSEVSVGFYDIRTTLEEYHGG